MWQAGLRPLDTAVPEALPSPEIVFHLVPLPKPAQPKSEWKEKQWNKRWGKDDQWKGKQWNKWQPYDTKKKAKAKVSDPTWCPKSSSTNCVSVDHHGRRLCFGYNLKEVQASGRRSTVQPWMAPLLEEGMPCATC